MLVITVPEGKYYADILIYVDLLHAFFWSSVMPGDLHFSQAPPGALAISTAALGEDSTWAAAEILGTSTIVAMVIPLFG